MATIIAYFIIFILFGCYYRYKKTKNRKFGESPINKLIEKAYRKWYRKSSYLLNKEITKVPEINKLLYDLKIELEEVGITEKQIIEYIGFVENTSASSRVGIKDAVIAILGFFTTNSLIKKRN